MEIIKPGSMPGNPAVARQGEQRDAVFGNWAMKNYPKAL